MKRGDGSVVSCVFSLHAKEGKKNLVLNTCLPPINIFIIVCSSMQKLAGFSLNVKANYST